MRFEVRLSISHLTGYLLEKPRKSEIFTDFIFNFKNQGILMKFYYSWNEKKNSLIDHFVLIL